MTSEGVEVAAAFALALVKAIRVRVAVALRVAGVCARAPYGVKRSALFCRPP